MMRTLLIMMLLFMVNCTTRTIDKEVSANKEKIKYQPENLPEIEFTKTVYDFGRITEGEIVGTNFSFKNTGNSDLIILNADASCGCTIPKWNKEPVPPGGEDTLEVKFDSSGRTGIQNKSITVHTNGKTEHAILTIIAEVVPE